MQFDEQNGYWHGNVFDFIIWNTTAMYIKILSICMYHITSYHSIAYFCICGRDKASYSVIGKGIILRQFNPLSVQAKIKYSEQTWPIQWLLIFCIDMSSAAMVWTPVYHDYISVCRNYADKRFSSLGTILVRRGLRYDHYDWYSVIFANDSDAAASWQIISWGTCNPCALTPAPVWAGWTCPWVLMSLFNNPCPRYPIWVCTAGPPGEGHCQTGSCQNCILGVAETYDP